MSYNYYLGFIVLVLVLARTCFCLRNNCPLGIRNRDDGLCDVEPEDEEYFLSSIHPMSARAQMQSNNLYSHIPYHQSEYTLHRVKRGILLGPGSGESDSLSANTAPLLAVNEPELKQQSYSIAGNTEWTPAIDVAFPAFCRSFKRLYISAKGYVSFDYKYRANPVTFPDTSNVDILAPYLAYTKGWSNAWTYVSHFRATDQSTSVKAVIQEVVTEVNDFESSTGWEPSDVIVVTWNGTVPDYCSVVPSFGCDAWQSNVFQVVIATDGTKTYSLTNFKFDGIKGSHIGKNIRFGYQFRLKKFEVAFMSGTTLMHTADKVAGNTKSGKAGRWIFRLFDVDQNAEPTTCNQYEYKCLNWISKTASNVQWLQWLLPPCPCNSLQAFLDYGFVRTYSPHSDQYCFSSRWFLYYQAFFPKHLQYFVEQRCCYRATWRRGRLPFPWGPLITADTSTEAPGFMSLLPLTPGQQTDNTGHDYCCIKSRRFCHRFYAARSTDRCTWYKPPRFCTAWGDPHIKTLDGFGYTFNGLGNYWLVKTLNRGSNSEPLFNLQARTAQVLTQDGTPGNATAYTILVAQDNNSDIVEIKIVVPNDMEMYLNKARHDAFDATVFPHEIQLDKDSHITFVTRESQNVTVVNFPSGWTMKLTALLGYLSVDVSASQLNTSSIETGGLLGVMDGNKDNDLTAEDGTTVLPLTSTDSDIYTNFGQTWAVKTAGDSLFSDSVFGYDTTFMPEFNPCQTFNLTHEAETVCLNSTAKECMYDYCVTRNSELASDTLIREQTFTEDQQVRINTIPRVITVSLIKAYIGQEVSFQVNGTDDDGDTVSLGLASSVPGSNFDFTTGLFKWTPPNDSPVLIGFVATDPSGASSPVTEVDVVLCDNCNNNGVCDFTDQRGDTTVSSFYKAACDCKPGYDGISCENDINGCLGNPCENCTDLTPAEEAASNFTRGYRCNCDAGYRVVQDICINIDECTESNGTLCDQICVDTDGSYHCECQPGYRLEADGTNCTNIDECTELTHNCTQLCNDNPGGFTCDCHGGWTLQPDGVTCNPPSQCAASCQQLCIVEPSGPKCECMPGFEVVPGSPSDCQDINECQGNHTCSHQCNDIAGGYTCLCPTGYSLSSDQRTCIECDNQHWGDSCAQPCNCSANVLGCNKTHGCVNCVSGYRGYNCEINIDECTEIGGLCTGSNEKCVDTIGSYICQCQSGYERNNVDVCEPIPSTVPPTTVTTETTTITSGTYTPTTTQPTAAPTTQAAEPTTQPTVTAGLIKLELKTNMIYKNVYANKNDPETLKLAAEWKKKLEELYADLPQFKSVSDVTFSFSFNQLVVTYQLDLTDDSAVNTSHALGYIKQQLTNSKNKIQVDNRQIIVDAVTAKLNGTEVAIDDACSLLNSEGTCNDGTCQVQDDINKPPVCVCNSGYIGEFCNMEALTAQQSAPVEVIVASVLAALLFVASCIGAAFIYRRRRSRPPPKSRSLTDWEDDSRSSSSNRSSSERTERSLWFSPYSKSNMYRAYGMPHGHNVGYPGYYRKFEPYY